MVRQRNSGKRLGRAADKSVVPASSSDVVSSPDQAQFDSLNKALPLGVGIVRGRVFASVNDRLCEMTGYSRDELLGKSSRMLYPSQEEYDRVGREKYGEIAAKGHGSVETRWVRKDCSVMDIFLSSAPIVPGNNAEGVTFTAMDISSRKKTERLLRIQYDLALALSLASDMKDALMMVLESAVRVDGADSGGIYLVDHVSGGLDLVASIGMSRQFIGKVCHYDKRDAQTGVVMQGMPIISPYSKIMKTRDRARDREGLKALAIIPILHDGKVIACLNLASHTEEVFSVESRNAIIAIGAQVGSMFARIDAEAELRNERSLFVAGPVVVVKWRYAPDWPVEYISPNVTGLLGFRPEDFTEGRVLYTKLIHPDDAGRVAKEVETYAEDDVKWYEQEYRIARSDGSYRWIRDFTTVVKSNNGQVSHHHGYVQDITDRKSAEEERRKMELSMQHTQKLESLGVLAGGIAHDFNNLLMAILGNLNLALSDLSPSSPVRDNLKAAEGASHRAADLCRQMLAYSGKVDVAREALDVNEVVEEMAHILSVSIQKKITLAYNCSPSLPLIEADATQVRQIVMNLVINASDAIGRKSGVIKLTTGVRDCSHEYLATGFCTENLDDGSYVYLEVKDSGCGMDKETIGRIFDPFFTTKTTGRGLGLAAVLGIVRTHGGTIIVESEPGNGSTFTVLFPEAKGRMARHKDEDNDVAGEWHGTGTILVVDDDEWVLTVSRTIFERIGFTVISSMDVHAALKLFRDNCGAIECVVLDMIMPEMNGEELLVEMRKIKPQVRAVMTSGYAESELSSETVQSGMVEFVQKPFDLPAAARVMKKIFSLKHRRK